jgi:hypothetical protein
LESRMRGNVQVSVRWGGVGVPGQPGPGLLPYSGEPSKACKELLRKPCVHEAPKGVEVKLDNC